MWRQAASERVSSLRQDLAARKADLRRAREARDNAPVTTALAGTLMSGAASSTPLASGGYVFPVGGGAATLSVSQTHHDYPAADIAAPMGTPVYVHANGTVVSAWHSSNGRCGIGVTLRTDDGLTWTYCHFSYLDPSVTAGTALAAGAPIALVGSTGNSSGPHLHLQLQPTTAYPQDFGWFRSFAGTAFRWQDGEPSRPVIGTAAGSATAFFGAQGEPSPGEGPVVAFTR
jgi:murein DD-endopeptidase MepM/ murein hydrolase activator NlpD